MDFVFSFTDAFVFIRPLRLLAVREMRPVATDVASGVVCLSVCVLVTRMCCAGTAESIEMPFGGQTHVDSRNRALDGVKAAREG